MTALEDLWGRRDQPGVRDELILHYQPLVERVAGGMSTGLPASVDRADLIGDGMFGLIEAVNTFDPGLGAFEPWAMQRIRGAILDSLRHIDWAPRDMRPRVRQIENARAALQAKLRREPTDDELAAAMGMTKAAVSRLLYEGETATVGRFDPELDEWHGYINSRVDMSTPSGSLFDPEYLADQLADAIVELPDRERVVFILYYVEEITLEDIGKHLGVSKVRASQLRDDAVLRMKERLVAA